MAQECSQGLLLPDHVVCVRGCVCLCSRVSTEGVKGMGQVGGWWVLTLCNSVVVYPGEYSQWKQHLRHIDIIGWSTPRPTYKQPYWVVHRLW